MVIDDNDMIIALLEKFLHKHGYDVFSAQSGTEALAMFENFSPDLVLLDFHVPDKNGFLIFQDLKHLSQKYSKETSFILITAEESKEIEKKAKEIGMDGFLQKRRFKMRQIWDSRDAFGNY